MPSSETTSVEDFYPRPPRGGRLKVQRPRRRNRAISIHALREEGDRLRQPERHEQAISIHALREEGDMCDELMELTDKKFLSTPSARRATRSRQITQALPADFYPRPPRGGRRGCAHGLPLRKNFYPRPPRGGRRIVELLGDVPRIISIHALREEGDHEPTAADLHRIHISIHALREEGDC